MSVARCQWKSTENEDEDEDDDEEFIRGIFRPVAPKTRTDSDGFVGKEGFSARRIRDSGEGCPQAFQD
jgi:hypothetical protein